MIRNRLWLLVAILVILIGFYPGIYFLIDRKFGLLSSKSNELLTNPFWNIGFYIHIILGGIALLTGWTQFNSNFRNKNIIFHRRIGMVYIISVAFSAFAGIYIGFFATGGLPSALGFICLGICWFSITLMAFINIKKRNIYIHQKLMVYSYTACFAALTLRIWLPILILIFKDFITAYTIVAWLCWVPNLFVAKLITNSMQTNVT